MSLVLRGMVLSATAPFILAPNSAQTLLPFNHKSSSFLHSTVVSWDTKKFYAFPRGRDHFLLPPEALDFCLRLPPHGTMSINLRFLLLRREESEEMVFIPSPSCSWLSPQCPHCCINLFPLPSSQPFSEHPVLGEQLANEYRLLFIWAPSLAQLPH